MHFYNRLTLGVDSVQNGFHSQLSLQNIKRLKVIYFVDIKFKKII